MQLTPLVPYARLPRAYHGHHIVTSTVDAFGRAHWLLAEREPAAEPYDAVVVTVYDDAHTATWLHGLTSRHADLAVLPDGGFVTAAPRSRPDEAHVQVFDALGRVSRTFRVGDGVEHLLADESGALWVGHFDEGVYGDDPLSWPGLRRWDVTGEPLWTYDHRDSGEISDCYALNVHRTHAWACAYRHFDLLEIRPGRRPVAHANPVRGANALAVHGDRVAFFGGYGDEHDRLVAARLSGGAVHPQVTGRLTRPDGSPVGRRRVVSRGPRIHVQERPGTEWYVFELGA
ncbi:hypothetical protein [Streptomyces tritici]|uniref:hypothetical protein n=1 Tax=Streptomyces tritici TaxID=2054410 RepID=UPI003AF0A408